MLILLWIFTLFIFTYWFDFISSYCSSVWVLSVLKKKSFVHCSSQVRQAEKLKEPLVLCVITHFTYQTIVKFVSYSYKYMYITENKQMCRTLARIYAVSKNGFVNQNVYTESIRSIQKLTKSNKISIEVRLSTTLCYGWQETHYRTDVCRTI